MSRTAAATSLIIETPKGPCIAGRRMTIYVILEHLRSGCDREFIKKYLLLSDTQLDAAIEYIDLHRDEVEKDYTDIVRRSEESRAHYETLYRERSPYDPTVLGEKRVARMRLDLASKHETGFGPRNDHQNPA